MVLLKKKAPSLTDKELNAEFFQKLETRGSDDLPVEVVVPRRTLQSSHSHGDEGKELNDDSSRGTAGHDEKTCNDSNDIVSSTSASSNDMFKPKELFNKTEEPDDSVRDKFTESRAFKFRDARAKPSDLDERAVNSLRDPSAPRSISRIDGHSESFMNSKGNWLGIQRQLSLLERQQASLMNMLQVCFYGNV